MSETAVLLTAFYALVAASLAYGWLRGGSAERLGVLLLTGMALFSWATEDLAPARFVSVDPLSLVEDAAGFAGFTWIGLRARRFWPLWTAALQLLSLGAHFARAIDVAIHPMAYSLMTSLPTLLACLSVAAGAATYRSRRRRASQMGCRGAIPASWQGRSSD